MRNTITLHYQGNISITAIADLHMAEMAVNLFCQSISQYEEFEAEQVQKEIDKGKEKP